VVLLPILPLFSILPLLPKVMLNFYSLGITQYLNRYMSQG